MDSLAEIISTRQLFAFILYVLIALHGHSFIYLSPLRFYS